VTARIDILGATSRHRRRDTTVEQEVRVDTEALRRVARDVATLRDDVDAAGREVDAAATEIGTRMAGWRLARVSEDNVFAWRDDARQITGRLEEYADALERCARDYQYSDRISAEAFELFPEAW
jgi:uncharacterized protein YukE